MKMKEYIPTLQLHSTAVGKYARRPLNHAVRELSQRALAQRIVHRVHFRGKTALDTIKKRGIECNIILKPHLITSTKQAEQPLG